MIISFWKSEHGGGTAKAFHKFSTTTPYPAVYGLRALTSAARFNHMLVGHKERGEEWGQLCSYRSNLDLQKICFSANYFYSGLDPDLVQEE